MPPVDVAKRLSTRDGAEVAYWVLEPEGGSERAVLLLHGAASNHTRWSELVEATTLARDWRIIRPDQRGNGESTLRTRQGLDVWCRDILEMLDAEGQSEAVVVGHSLGAQIALRLAHRAPDRVQGLVLIDPVFRSALRGKPAIYSRFRGLFLLLAAGIAALNRLGLRRRHIPNRDLRELDEATREAMAGGEALEVIAQRYSALGPILAHMPTANYFRQVAATSGPVPPLEEIRCPTLVLMSAKITFADVEVARRELAKLPDAELVGLSANHWPLTEAPDETRRAIEAWIESRFGEVTARPPNARSASRRSLRGRPQPPEPGSSGGRRHSEGG